MKKVILGSAMILAGIISIAQVLAGSMANECAVNGAFPTLWTISQYGLMPTIYIFAGIAIIGFVLAAWGLIDKKD